MDLLCFSKIINKIYFVTVCSFDDFQNYCFKFYTNFLSHEGLFCSFKLFHVFGDLTKNILRQGVIDNQRRFLSLPNSVKHFEQNIWEEI